MPLDGLWTVCDDSNLHGFAENGTHTEITSLKKFLTQREVSLRNEPDPLQVEFQVLQELALRNPQLKNLESQLTDEKSKLRACSIFAKKEAWAADYCCHA